MKDLLAARGAGVRQVEGRGNVHATIVLRIGSITIRDPRLNSRAGALADDTRTPGPADPLLLSNLPTHLFTEE